MHVKDERTNFPTTSHVRPFFLENSSYFDTPITLLYTRTIGNPEFGARATGKIGKTDFGLPAIDDRDPGTFVAPTDPLYRKRAVTTVARVSQDIGKGSSIGAEYAQRTLAWRRKSRGCIDPLISSLSRTKQVSTQVLFTWLPHPGTAVYAGYNSDLQNLDHTLCTRLTTGQCDGNYPVMPRASQYLNDGRENLHQGVLSSALRMAAPALPVQRAGQTAAS